MTQQMVVGLFRDMLFTSFWLAAPLLTAGFIAGIVISVFQIITSMQDAAVASVPRLVAFLVAIVLLLPWMLTRMVAYMTSLFGDFSRFAR